MENPFGLVQHVLGNGFAEGGDVLLELFEIVDAEHEMRDLPPATDERQRQRPPGDPGRGTEFAEAPHKRTRRRIF